jgi:hypothetical protein
VPASEIRIFTSVHFIEKMFNSEQSTFRTPAMFGSQQGAMPHRNVESFCRNEDTGAG